jgi:hypothetical protein
MRKRNPVEVQALPYGCLDLEGRIRGTKVLNNYLVRQDGKLGAPGLAKRQWQQPMNLITPPLVRSSCAIRSSIRAVHAMESLAQSSPSGAWACENLANSVEISSRVRPGSPKRRSGHLLDVGGY